MNIDYLVWLAIKALLGNKGATYVRIGRNAVAEVVVKNHPVPVEIFGIPDETAIHGQNGSYMGV